MQRQYRVTVRGKFDTLSAEQRRLLSSQQEDHDVFGSRFTPEGSFIYGPELRYFQYRFALTISDESPDDAQVLAQAQAEEAAQRDLRRRGLSGTFREASVVSLDAMKVRGRTRS